MKWKVNIRKRGREDLRQVTIRLGNLFFPLGWGRKDERRKVMKRKLLTR